MEKIISYAPTRLRVIRVSIGPDRIRFGNYATSFDVTNHTSHTIMMSSTCVKLGSNGTSIIMAFPGNVKIRKGVHAQLKRDGLAKKKKVNRYFVDFFT